MIQYRKPRRQEERETQEACSDFLALDGWRRIRTDLPHLRGLGVQEKGMADDLYIRYAMGDRSTVPDRSESWDTYPTEAEVMWIEWKRRTGKTAAHQHAWHATERARGALTLIAGIDFVPSVDGFQEWYYASGLARRVRPQKQVSA